MSLNGIDISGYDEGIDIKSVSADFIIVKATEGTQGTIYNKNYRRMADKVLSSGKLLGFYHYANGEDPIEEAHCFYDAIKLYVGKAIFCLDWEGQGNRLFDSGDDVKWCKQFLDCLAELTNSTPFIYISKTVCREHNWSKVSNKYTLWGAEYAYENYIFQGYDEDPWQSSYSWGSWGDNVTIHQYGYVNPKPNNGGQTKLDGDIFYGTKEDWDRFCGGEHKMSLRDEVVEAVRSQIGQPYNSMTDGRNGDGWGCAMLCAYAYNVVLGTDYYGSVWNFTGDALGQGVNQGGGEFVFTDDPQPGDTVAYMPPGYTGTDYDDYAHVAMYVGDDRVVGAWGSGNIGNYNYQPGRGVSEDYIWEQSRGGEYRFLRCTRIDDSPAPKQQDIPDGGKGAVYRFFDPNSGVHFYTASLEEARNVSSWMNYEGIAWYTSGEGQKIYRLYNDQNGDHFLTASLEEKNSVSSWMRDEGIAFVTNGAIPVYRLYDRSNGSHFYTTSVAERDSVLNSMDNEGIAFYCLGDDPNSIMNKMPVQQKSNPKNNNGLKYRSHVQTAGWLEWVRDGQTSGTEGFARRLESIEFNFPEGIKADVHLHVQGLGWIASETDNKGYLYIGTTGQGRRAEAIEIHIIKMPDRFKNMDIYYQTHCQGIGWGDVKRSGEISGTTGQSRRMEAVRIWMA